jgi:hypothetical protein
LTTLLVKSSLYLVFEQDGGLFCEADTAFDTR